MEGVTPQEEGRACTTSDIAVSARNLSKIFRTYETPLERFKQVLFGCKRRYCKEYNALNDISFKLLKGEVLGLVGRNGAGRSTLLRLISGMLTPTSGELTIQGKVVAISELEAGFNPKFTGRENIYLSAAVTGVSQKEIDDKVEEVIEFSGIRTFIDLPVATYSSGMCVRLAFSIATSVVPDILLIDEALPVGDGDFARRSFAHIAAMRDAGKTVLLCTHSLCQLDVCTRVIWLEQGRIGGSGKPDQVISAYQSFLDQLDGKGSAEKAPSIKPRWRPASADDVSQTALLALFEQVFGFPQNPLVWRWKYRFADTPGTVVLEGERLVAFCGGIPREGLVFGQPESMVQMGDVMVAKQVRGILSKKGPFYLAIKEFFGSKVGPGLRYSITFGFPNERASKVGVIRGIYNIVDKIVEPRWAPLSSASQQPYISSLIDTATDTSWQQQIDVLWQAMKQDINDVAIGCRDSLWIKHRYIDRPNADYLLYFVTSQSEVGDIAPVGLLVLKRHENNGMELLDVVGPRSSAPVLINAARQITATDQAPYLFAWATPSTLAWFASTAPQVNSTEVLIPGSNVNSPEHALRIKDRWWLLGGDSDFR